LSIRVGLRTMARLAVKLATILFSGFEDGTAQGWTIFCSGSGGTWSISTAKPRTGNYSVWGAAGSTGALQLSLNVDYSAFTTFSITFWGYNAMTWGTQLMRFFVNGSQKKAVTAVKGAWTSLTYSCPTSGMNTILCELFSTAPTNCYIDDITITLSR